MLKCSSCDRNLALIQLWNNDCIWHVCYDVGTECTKFKQGLWGCHLSWKMFIRLNCLVSFSSNHVMCGIRDLWPAVKETKFLHPSADGPHRSAGRQKGGGQLRGGGCSRGWGTADPELSQHVGWSIPAPGPKTGSGQTLMAGKLGSSAPKGRMSVGKMGQLTRYGVLLWPELCPPKSYPGTSGCDCLWRRGL